MTNTDLANKMLKLAEIDKLPDSHPIRVRAIELDEATTGFCSDPQTCDVRRFMGCWARARRAWSDYTGEPII